MGKMGLLALLAMPRSHSQAGQWASPVTLKPCDTADPHQQWVTAGEGDAGHVRDRASGRCLQVAGCATTAMESKVVVDACDSGCAAATPAAAAWKWTTSDPKNADVFKLGTAQHDGQDVCLDTALEMGGAAQIWTCHGGAMPTQHNQNFKRESETLQVQLSPPVIQCSGEHCCLAAAEPPPGCFAAGVCGSIGAWGSTFLLVFVCAAALYGGGGVLYGVKASGKAPAEAHPHSEMWRGLRALVVDGAQWTVARLLSQTLERGEGGGGYEALGEPPITEGPEGEGEEEEDDDDDGDGQGS